MTPLSLMTSRNGLQPTRGRTADCLVVEEIWRVSASNLERYQAVELARRQHRTQALGRLPADKVGAGPMNVLVRPEQIRLVSPDLKQTDLGVRAFVQGVIFYGPDAGVTLLLLSGARKPNSRGEKLPARVPGHRCPHVGQEVLLSSKEMSLSTSRARAHKPGFPTTRGSVGSREAPAHYHLDQWQFDATWL